MGKHKKPRRSHKKLWRALGAVLGAAIVAVGGLWLISTRTGREINVYAVSDLSVNDDWITEAHTEGRVTTDKLQSVYISKTQQITEIYVAEGQTISRGDPILAFDTTLSELDLDRQAIQVSQLELDIQQAEEELAEIATYKIGSPSHSFSSPATSGGSLTWPDTMPFYRSGVGTAQDPMVYLWNDNCAYDDAFIRALADLAAELQAAQTAPAPTDPPADEAETPAPTDPPADEAETPAPSDPPADEAETPAPSNPPADEAETPAPSDPPADETETPAPSDPPADETETPAPSDPPTDETEPPDPYVYAVFEVRESDALNGAILRCWEMAILLGEDGSWTFRLTEPVYEPEGDDAEAPEVYIDTNTYYTAAEVARLKTEAKQKILDLKLELKMAKLEYERLSYEFAGGTVYSDISGTVKTVRDPDAALEENQPVVLISGGGGYYVTAALSELELPSMHEGDTVSLQSWETNTVLTGEIVEISQYPDESGQYWHYSEGNENVSLYPFRIFADENANLREGEWVSVTYTPATVSDEGFYLDGPFLRDENGKSYVYVANADGLLEKRFVSTGGSLWGEYIKILGGLTEEDYIAFPYEQGAKDGAKTRQATLSELYAY